MLFRSTALTFADEGLLLLEHVSPSNPTPPPPGWPLHYLLPLPGRFSSHIFARFSTTASRVLLKYHLLRDAFSSVQLLSRVQFFVTPWTAACQASLSITNSQSLLKFMSMDSVMLSNHLILCRPLLLPPSIFPSIKQGLFK